MKKIVFKRKVSKSSATDAFELFSGNDKILMKAGAEKKV